MHAIANCHYSMRRYQLTAEWQRKSIRVHQGQWMNRCYLAAALAQQGHIDEAREAYSELLRIEPNFSMATFDYAFPSNDEARQHAKEGLIKAGMPEE